MLSKVYAAASDGFDGRIIEIECDMSRGLPGITIVGLPNKAVDEAKERVRSALKNSRLELPPRRITLNLAPADTPKDGTAYDVPMAIAILRASEQIEKNLLEQSLLVGELALNGNLRPIPGVLNHVQTAKGKGFKRIFIPTDCSEEASLIKGIDILPIKSLNDLYMHLTGKRLITPLKPLEDIQGSTESAVDFSDVHGQNQAKRALEIAAAGSHNILLNGPPGAGKTMLARSLLSILPPATREEIIDITKLHSLGNTHGYKVVRQRPFRSPHHTASDIAVIGGGQNPSPGEISLAHHGVLFLDEVPEFRSGVLEVLRQPLEDGEVTVARAKRSVTYPANFMLVATQNPCPCGYLNDEKRNCICNPAAINRYKKKLSGPLLDRIDMRVNVKKVEHEKLLKPEAAEPSTAVAKRVYGARKTAVARSGSTNSVLDNKSIKLFCKLDDSSKQLLKQAMQKLDLSARGYMRTLKVARTIADLDNSEKIAAQHLSEALQYR